MEDFDSYDIRRAPLTELEVQKNYREMVPRPDKEDYQRLKENIARNGLDPAKPIVINEDELVLDGHTRLQIAKELGIEWVYVTVKDLEDHYAEKRYIIETNLDQRHLTTAQRIELGEKLLEIKQEQARERQRQAGELYGKSHPKQCQNSNVDSKDSQLSPTLGQAVEKGKAIEVVARQVGVGEETLRKGLKIKQAAQTDPKIAKSWDKALQGKVSVNKVYQEVQEKAQEETHLQRMMKNVPDPPALPDEEIMYWLYRIADDQGVPREAIDGAIELSKVEGPGPPDESDLVFFWRLWSQDLFPPRLAWDMTMDWVRKWQKKQRAERPEELPVPDETHKLGPWALDYVHQAGLEDLVREFPEGTAHLIYNDVVADLEQVDLLGAFAGRALTPGKYLCVYVDKRHLPESMSRLSAAGLTYFWSCMVFRPDDKLEVPDLLIREKCRLLLIYQKGESAGAGWDWFEDAVENRRPSNREMVRQLVKGLTASWQLVVDPLVGSGITGQVARSLERRFLCFGTEEADVRAANQRISQVRLAEEPGSATP